MNDCPTKFKFDDECGCCHLFNDSIMCAIEVRIAGKSVLVCGYGDVDESCTFNFSDSGVRVFVVECDIRALVFFRWQPWKASCPDRHGWLGELGKDRFDKSNSVSKLIVAGMLPSDGDKCALAFLREGDGFDD